MNHDLLNPPPLVMLYEIALPDGVTILRLTKRGEISFQGDIYTEFPITITGLGVAATDEVARPKLSVMNADGLLSSLARQGILEGSKVRIYTVVDTVDLSGVTAFLPLALRVFYIYQITLLNRQLVEFELRGVGDFPESTLPPRRFYPPEFNAVNL